MGSSPKELARGEESHGSSQGRQEGVSSSFSLVGSDWGKFLAWRMEPVDKVRVGRDNGWSQAPGLEGAMGSDSRLKS